MQYYATRLAAVSIRTRGHRILETSRTQPHLLLERIGDCLDYSRRFRLLMTTRSGGLKLVLILSFRIFKASSASLKNSWSTIMTADDECSRRKPIVEAFRRMLTAFRTAPLIGTPKWASYIAGVFGAITTT
ncbi:hypothetical protein HanOQP8_Chr11g0427631 [Helianthus annuus]|nr:hypothetical protein HanHA89_Chr11g0449761 [Helianthus annuus]KAJ0691318.1 hypothetical protein HanOQP8_Chr11g0427631 [Helianthus annuus]KAJ0823947.1 hypothetical protein HanLR1_Chr00c0124g0714041 [Helianthus annuus]